MSDGSVTCAENGGFRTHLPLPPVEAIDTIKESLAAFVPVHIKYPAIRIICRSNEISSNCEVRLLPASRRLLIYTNAHAGFMLDMSKALSVSVRARKAKLMRIRINFEFGRVQLIFPEQYGRWTLGILAAHEPGRALPGETKGGKKKEVDSNQSLNQSFEMEVVPWGKGAEPTKFEFDEMGVVEVANDSNTTPEHVDVYTQAVSISQRSISTHEVSEIRTQSISSFVESIQIQSTQSHHLTTVISTMTIQTTSMVEMMETQKSDSRISIVPSIDDESSSSTTLYTAKDSDSDSLGKANSLILKTPTSSCAKPRLSMRSTSSRLPQWPPPPSRESDSDSDNDNASVSVDNFGSLYKASPEDRMLRRPTKDRFCPMVTESAVEAANFKQDWGLEDDAVSLKSNASTRCFFYNLDRATAAGENNAANVDPSALKNTAYATGPMKSFNCLAAIRDKMNGYVVYVIGPQVLEFDDSTTNNFPTSPRSPGSPGVETTLTVPQIDPVSPTPSNTSIATAIELGDCVGESFV